MPSSIRWAAFIGHVGLLPHLIHKRGGFKVWGKTAEQARELMDECLELERMGAVGIEMECVTDRVATEITRRLRIPVFGIGSGVDTDGQFQVMTDVFGLQKEFGTSFCKRYVNLWEVCDETLRKAFEEVREGVFPDPSHTFAIPDEEFEAFKKSLD